jgi:hypothetical protein
MSVWAEAWEHVEKTIPQPQRLRLVRTLQWNDFRERVERSEDYFVHTLVGSLYRGDILILRGAFPAEFMYQLKAKTSAWMRSRPPEFHKMVEGSPDFHRIIDIDIGKKYSFAGCKHSAYFYRWNSDPLGIWPEITERWRVIKTVMGLHPTEYENFTPKDGVVDRIQVVRYPPASGYLEPHSDPWLHQRLFLSAYMGKRGVDYHGGGFYALDANNKVVELEDQIEVGDIAIGCATVVHGVAPCDRNKVPDWNADDGRWFLSLYSNASDEVPQRHTGRPEKIVIPEVMP